MKLKITLFTLLALTAFMVSGCGLAGSVLGGNKGGTVANLWSDVPAMPNATKANISIPPLANLIVQGFVSAANAQNSDSDTKLDKFDFIGYTTADSPQAVSDFYTVEAMKAAGWDSADMPGCQVGEGQGAAGGFCAFGKKDASNKQTVLMIMPVQDNSTKQTQIFYVRFEGTTTAQ